LEDKFRVLALIGEGGFAQVHLVESKKYQHKLAVKTYKKDFFTDPNIQLRFNREAKIWMDIGAHPNIVRLFYVDSKARHLYVGMEYIPPNQDAPNTLEGYLLSKQISLNQSIRWAIQFCHGMEYAYSRGLRAHRDIKPSNIMIDESKTLKISDFGIAAGFNEIINANNIPNNEKSKISAHLGFTKTGDWLGTPEYMSPEQFIDFSQCDVRSDIYSFGIVLFQMCNVGNLPFSTAHDEEDWMEAMQELHSTIPIPEFESPLQHIVKKCLNKHPDDRYQSFIELREDLEQILLENTGVKLPTPRPFEYTVGDIINRGNGYSRMGFFKEAIECYDNVIKNNAYQTDAINGKAMCLLEQGLDKEALALFNKAISLSPNTPNYWLNRGNYYFAREQYSRALSDYQDSIKLDSGDSFVWSNIGTCLLRMCKYTDSLFYFNKALEIECNLAETLGNKGAALCLLDQYDEALRCFDQALKLDPLFILIWCNKGICYLMMKNLDKANQCFDKASEIDNTYLLRFLSHIHELDIDDEVRSCFEKYKQIRELKEI
jgi:serine/threonine protein kinase